MNVKFKFLFFISLLMVLSGSLNQWIDKGDSGELFLSAKFLGVSHPSGYPLYNIVAKPFLELPGLRDPIALSLASLVFLCISAIFTMMIIEIFLEDIIFSITGAMTLTCGLTFLRTGLSQEIYSLFMMFFSISVYFFVRWITYKEKKDFLATFLSLGLLSAVHVTGLFYFVFFYILFIILKEKRQKEDFVLPVIFFVLPCMLYLYLIVRSDAFFSWGETGSISKALAHMSGSERGVGNRFFAFSFKEYLHQITVLLKHIHKEFSFLWIFVVPGVFFLYKYEKRYFYTFSGPFIICSSFYTLVARNLENRQHFFLISFYSIFLLFWAGLFWTHRYIFKKRKAIYLLFLPLMLFFLNKPDFSYAAMLDSYAYNASVSVSETKDNVLLTTGDEATFIMWYSKYIKGMFPDTKIVNTDMLQANWYNKKYGDLKQILNSDSNIYSDIYPQNIGFNKYISSHGILYYFADKYREPKVELFKKYRLNGLDKEYSLPEVEAIRLRYRDSYNQTGIELMKAGRKEEAKMMFEAALKIKGDLGIYSNLSKAQSEESFYRDSGELYMDRKEFGKAQEYFRKSNDTRRLARLYWKSGQYDKLKTLENIPDFYKGILRFREGDYRKAASFFALENSRDSLFYLALSLNKLGQKEKAIIILEKLYKKMPDREIHDALKNLKGYITVYE